MTEEDGSRVRAQNRRLVRANLALVRQLRPASILRWAVHDLRGVVDAEFAALLLNDSAGAAGLATFVHSGLAQGAAAGIVAGAPEARGVLGEAMRGRAPMRLRDVRDHPAHIGFPQGHPAMTSFVAAPIIHEAEVIGLLFATNKRGGVQFSEDDEAFVADLAGDLGRSRITAPEPATPDLLERLGSASQALRVEMEAIRSFLGSLSHELRGSISGIMVSSELLSDPSFGVVGDEQTRTIGKRIHVVASNLLSLVDNLLDLARLEAGRFDVMLQPVDLNAIIGDVEAVITPLASTAGVSLELAPMAGVPRVVGDPLRLRQVLVNLLSNAVKFTAPGGRAWLEVISTPGQVELAVGDTGRGIPADQLERIFEPFERAVGSNVPGVGLGLAICRRIVDLHGSRLTVASQPGAGSRFAFSLRTSREPLPPRLLRDRGDEAAVAGADGKLASILIVEDDPVNRQSIGDVLSGAGYRVRAVTTRAAAMAAVLELVPDVITLDVQLPDGSGLDIVGDLRSVAAPRELAIVALSADRIGNTAERARLAGCDRFALKPIAARELLGLIRSALEERRRRQP